MRVRCFIIVSVARVGPVRIVRLEVPSELSVNWFALMLRLMLFRSALLVLVAGVLCLEGLRLTRPTTVRLRETYEFSTPFGPRTASTVVEVRQFQSIPYLPGGEIGKMDVLGDAATVRLGGRDVYMMRGHRWLLEMGARYGTIEPRFDTADIRPSVSNSADFLRRLGRHRSTIRLDLKKLDPRLFQVIEFFQATDPRDPATFSKTNLKRFETEYPGISLRRVTFVTTDEPISRHLDDLLPWLDSKNPITTAKGTSITHWLRD